VGCRPGIATPLDEGDERGRKGGFAKYTTGMRLEKDYRLIS
jgi:hypothetical protein